MSYPDELIRGVPGKQYITKEGRTSYTLFSSGFSKNEGRSDEYDELSINWYDDGGAILDISTRMNPRTGIAQFETGYVILSRTEIDRLRRIAKANLSYERRILEDNCYHGNILIDKNTSTETKKMIYSSLALYCVIKEHLSA